MAKQVVSCLTNASNVSRLGVIFSSLDRNIHDKTDMYLGNIELRLEPQAY